MTEPSRFSPGLVAAIDQTDALLTQFINAYRQDMAHDPDMTFALTVWGILNSGVWDRDGIGQLLACAIRRLAAIETESPAWQD